jgi:hypothetical protein
MPHSKSLADISASFFPYRKFTLAQAIVGAIAELFHCYLVGHYGRDYFDSGDFRHG